MQFFQWTTDYQNYCREFNKRKRKPYDEFVRTRRIEQQAQGFPTHRLLAEDTWIKDGNPYYNIHPGLVSKLCKVDMGKIPSTMLKMPHDLRAVNIRFGAQHDEFTVHEEQHTDTRKSNVYGVAPAGSFVHSLLMIDLKSDEGRSILVLMDFNAWTHHKQPVYSMFSVKPTEGLTLEECVDQAKGQGRSQTYIDMLENVMRLCVSVGFLSDNPTLCEPDVLAKDRQEYARANEERRTFLAERSRRKGKNGFNIGTDMMFIGERPVTSRPAGEVTGRELEYQHIRTGHPHLVRYGEGKKLVKLMWYAPTTVRPDKPFKS